MKKLMITALAGLTALGAMAEGFRYATVLR